MPSCAIKGCHARKDKNHPQITFHLLPRKEPWKTKWLNIIGIENLKSHYKNWHICSLHFHESCFNRTLSVVRLRDGALPFPPVLPAVTVSNCEDNGNEDNTDPLSTDLDSLACARRIIQEQTYEIDKLKKRCNKLYKHSKRLAERVRRRDKKIAIFTDIIKDIKERNSLTSQEITLLEECTAVEPEESPERLIVKPKEPSTLEKEILQKSKKSNDDAAYLLVIK